MPDRIPGEWPPRRRSASQDPLADVRDFLTKVLSAGGRGGGVSSWRVNPLLVVGILLVAWALTGIYIVAPDQRGIVLRFGKVVRETGSGPHYHLPWPIEQVMKPSVTAIRKEEVGFRTLSQAPARYQDVDVEALMLTGDENIVKLEFIVQYKVRSDATGATDFLFNVRNPVETVRAAAEAAMREVLGRTEIDQALTEGKEEIQQETQRVLQQILDRYSSGLEVVTVKLQDVDPPDQVSDAFKDVISAQQDRERLINEALGYANDVVPRARGQAAQLLNEAEGYRQAKLLDAAGTAQRFSALEQEYAKAKNVTRRRLYLETMEAILPEMNKIILDDLAGRQAVPYLPLDPFLPRRAEPAAPAAPGGR